jgi:thioredoxin reductase
MRQRRCDPPVAGQEPGRFEASSVHYWASPLEAKLCANQEITLVGGCNSAGQAAAYLAGQVAKVWLLLRGPDFNASMSRYLADRIAGLPNVEVVIWRFSRPSTSRCISKDGGPRSHRAANF